MNILVLFLASAFGHNVDVPVNYGGNITMQECKGGVVPDYSHEFTKHGLFHTKFKIDGIMYSACTMITMIPAEDICITENAKFAYHQGRLATYVKHGNPLWPKYKEDMCKKSGGMCFVSENIEDSGVDYISWPDKTATESYLNPQPDWVKKIVGGFEDLPFDNWKYIEFEELKKHYKVCK